jgi:thioesterase domain-containing protein
VLGRANVPVDVDFFELGGTSLGAMQVLALAEREFGRPVPLATLIEAPTVTAFARKMVSDEATPWRALIALQTTGARTPFFGIHHGGGGVYGYAALARRLGPDQPVYAFQEPGYEPGSTPLDSIEALAELYLDELRSFQPHGPYRLGGFCFGGVIAFEMARRLAVEGEVVDVLALIDAGNPNPDERPNLETRVGQHRQRLSTLGLAGKAAYLARWFARRAAWEVERRYLTVRHHAVLGTNWVFRRLKRRAPDYVHQYALLQWNGRLQSQYRAGVFPGSATLIRGYYPDLHLEHDFGWSRIVQGGVSVHLIAGGHLDLMNGPNIQQVVDVLAPLLEASEGTAPVAQDAEPDSQIDATASVATSAARG